MKNIYTELKILIGILTVAVVVLLAIVFTQKVGDIFLGDRTNTTVKSTDASETNLYGGPMGSVLSNASGITVTAGATGSLPAGTYYLKITSTDYSGGQTLPSSELTCSPTVTATGSCTVALTLNARASTTRIWVATSTGVYYGYQSATSSSLIATTTGLTVGTLPTSNTAFNDIGIARYNANGITLTDGYLSNLQVDILGNLKVTLQTALSYLIDSITNYEAGYTCTNIVSTTTTTLITGSGILDSVCNNKPVASQVITIYDNTAGSGTKIGTITKPATLLSDDTACKRYHANVGTGLTIVTSGGAVAPDITACYR